LAIAFFSSTTVLRRHFDDGRLSAEEQPRSHSQPLALAYLCGVAHG